VTTSGVAAVAVIGGGPAGSSAALELARLGIETVLIEQSDGSGNPIGECLAPSISPLLQRLRIEDVLQESGALPSYGNQSSWGGDGAPADRDFLREPHGHGWHLDRPAFNRCLLDAVETTGVAVWRRNRVASLERMNEGWRIRTESPDGEKVLNARMLVDASGRRSVVARRERVRRRTLDSQIAAVGFLDSHAASLQDATTWIEAAAGGWWYAALLPDQRLAVAWFTDPDLLAANAARRPENWWELLHTSDLVGRLVATHGYGIPQEIGVFAAGSSLLAQPMGDGWIAAGDAAAAHDPLSSHGIGSALAGGRRAARVVAETLGGDASAFTAYRERLFADYARYLWERHAYYADERRWAGMPFWARRHGEAQTLIAQVPVLEGNLSRR
jgi:flavin-dependent dehydrogenase